ncbi:MAG TPA: hypothetical protein VM492_02530 [Sumerlaeia bacterium]|nr:hypothetical protein [Sumerlaeia bacterium]
MDRFERRVSSDLFLMATALVIAFAVWTIAKRGDFIQETVTLNLRLRNVPENILAEPMVRQAQITLAVARTMSARILPSQFVVEVDWNDLPNPREWCGVEDFRPSPPIALDFGHIQRTGSVASSATAEDDLQQQAFAAAGALPIRYILIEPSRIQVKAKFITRVARPEFRTKGKPADGYRLVEPITSSAGAILLTASEERLKELAPPGADGDDGVGAEGAIEISTEEIDLADKRFSFSEVVRLRLPPGTDLVYRDQRIEARVNIEEIIVKRTIDGVAISVQPADRNLVARYAPEQAAVTVSGPEHILRDLEAEDFSVRPSQPPQEQGGLESTVDLKALFSAKAAARTVESVTILSVSPETLRLRFDWRSPDEADGVR